LGTAGRTVRCSRCKEVWLARPEDAVDAIAPVPAMAAAGPSSAESDAASEWEAMARQEEAETTPVVDSPSISADWPDEASRDGADWPSIAREDVESHADTASQRRGLLRRLLPPLPRPHLHLPAATLPTACAAMGALLLALIVWRADVVRLLPQTALFYKMVGLDVNLRGLVFKDIKVSNETVDGKPVKAVAQPTKQGFLYVFDRITGKPIWPIPERPVEVGNVPGLVLNFVRGAFPNPAVHGAASVRFSLAQPAKVTIRFYNVAGRVVREATVEGHVGSDNVFRWDGTMNDGTRAGSGVYFYRLSAPGVQFENNSQRMVLLGQATR